MVSRFVCACVTVGFCALGLGSEQTGAVAVKIDRASRRTQLPDKEEVDSALAKQETLGERALGVLKDTSREREERRVAALMLGRLRYRPAIPLLLKYLDLLQVEVQPPPPVVPGLPPGIGNGFIDTEGMYPCVTALATYGMDAVPAIVEAYLDEQASQDRLFLLYLSLERRVGEGTRCYIIGLRNETKNPFVRERLDDLLRDKAIR